MDVVAADAFGRVRQIVVKPAHTTLTRTWGLAVWTPAFTAFLHAHLAQAPAEGAALHVGNVIQAAIAAGMRVEGIAVSEQPFVDIGLPEQLARARLHVSARP